MHQRSQSCVKGGKITRSIYKWMIYQYISWKTLKKHQHTRWVPCLWTWQGHECPHVRHVTLTTNSSGHLQPSYPFTLVTAAGNQLQQLTNMFLYFCFLLYFKTFLYTIQVFFSFLSFFTKEQKKSFHVFFPFVKSKHQTDKDA